MISEETVKRAKYGNDDAFAKLYEAIYVDMYKTAYYMLQNEEDAKDAVGEAVVDMYKDIHKLEECKAFKAWAMRILWVKCKLKRKEYCHKDEKLETHGDIPATCNVEKQMVLKNDIDKAMECLTDEERMIVVCSAVAGMNSTQISEVTRISKGTIRSKLSRALKKVRAGLEEYYE